MSLTCGLITVEATPGKEPGKEPAAAEFAASRNEVKYASIGSEYLFAPIASIPWVR